MDDPTDLSGMSADSFFEQDGLSSLDGGWFDPSAAQQAALRYEGQVSAARASSDRRAEGLALLGLGGVYNQLGDERRAIGILDQALAIARALGDQRIEALVMIYLGDAHNQLGDARGALGHYAQSLVLLRALGDRGGEGLVLSHLGDVYTSLGDTHRAWECYTQGRTLFGALGDRRREAAVCWSMGEMLAGQRAYARAAELMQVLVEYEREQGDAEMEHHALILAQVRARQPDEPQA